MIESEREALASNFRSRLRAGLWRCNSISQHPLCPLPSCPNVYHLRSQCSYSLVPFFKLKKHCTTILVLLVQSSPICAEMLKVTRKMSLAAHLGLFKASLEFVRRYKAHDGSCPEFFGIGNISTVRFLCVKTLEPAIFILMKKGSGAEYQELLCSRHKVAEARWLGRPSGLGSGSNFTASPSSVERGLKPVTKNALNGCYVLI
ncbi:hypothetical protein F5X98DRAFT_218363 [Xylaria grammica]|nr:hypothetical protein F5X98DRAFT_218363 [Xylaria grammica]